MARTPTKRGDTTDTDHVRAKTVVTSISKITERAPGKEACLVVIYGIDLGKKYNLDAATLVLGLSELQLPFKGGVLVPAPDVLVSGLVTDASGNWAASFTWPSGVPTGLALTFQAWLPDPAAVAGLAASDGLRATQP